MGMSIEKSTRILVDRYIDTYVVCGGANYNPTINITREDYEAFQVAISTMRKYQKIVDIVSLNGEEFKQCGLKELKEILEVIADGHDD